MRIEDLEKIKQYLLDPNNRQRKFGFWKVLTPEFSEERRKQILQFLYIEANGNINVMDNMLRQLIDAKKHKVYGRTQVYASETNHVPSVRIIYDEKGYPKELVGYRPNADVGPLKGQHRPSNSRIFRKGDEQPSERYKETEEKIMDAVQELRHLYGIYASPVFLNQAVHNINDYLRKANGRPGLKKSMNFILDKLRQKKWFLDSDGNLSFTQTEDSVIPNVNESKTIVITETVAELLKEDIEMTEYKFYSNIKQFLHDLLIDPVNAKVPDLLKYYNITRSKLLYYLGQENVVEKEEKIRDTDENGQPVTAKMIVKYKVPKKNLDRKLKRLYIKFFEKNVPVKNNIDYFTEDFFKNVYNEHINEDGEGATTCDASSGQFSQPMFPIQRRKFTGTVEEETTTSNVGDYQYDVPFIGDKETLSRKNGIGGSVSINKD